MTYTTRTVAEREIATPWSYRFENGEDEPRRVADELFADYAKRGVGAVVSTDAAAPGTGRVVYRITRVTADAIYGVEISNTIRELHPSEVV